MKISKLIIIIHLIFIILLVSCSKKNESSASLSGCSVKFPEEQIFNKAQGYLKENYPGQTIKEVRLTGCEGSKSLFEARVYENDAEVAVVLVRGDTGEVTYIGK